MQTEVKSKIEFKNMYIVLLLNENKVFPNNVIAMDYTDNELWKVNDIIKAIDPCGITVIKKIDENTLRIISSVGMMYEIDIIERKIIKSVIIR